MNTLTENVEKKRGSDHFYLRRAAEVVGFQEGQGAGEIRVNSNDPIGTRIAPGRILFKT